MDNSPPTSPADLAWHITRRWQSFEGEIRVAFLRVLLLGLFYAVQLVHFLVFSEGSQADTEFHRQITFLVAAWLLISLAVLVSLRQKFFPAWLMFATCSLDLILLFVAAAMGSGPASPLVVCFYLIVGLSALRFSLPLVCFASGGAILAYWALVGWADPGWFDAEHVTPPVQQMVVICSLAATGLAAGQLVMMTRSTAQDYAARLQNAAGAARTAEESSARAPVIKSPQP
jgi:hypothetical protein